MRCNGDGAGLRANKCAVPEKYIGSMHDFLNPVLRATIYGFVPGVCARKTSPHSKNKPYYNTQAKRHSPWAKRLREKTPEGSSRAKWLTATCKAKWEPFTLSRSNNVLMCSYLLHRNASSTCVCPSAKDMLIVRLSLAVVHWACGCCCQPRRSSSSFRATSDIHGFSGWSGTLVIMPSLDSPALNSRWAFYVCIVLFRPISEKECTPMDSGLRHFHLGVFLE